MHKKKLIFRYWYQIILLGSTKRTVDHYVKCFIDGRNVFMTLFNQVRYKRDRQRKQNNTNCSPKVIHFMYNDIVYHIRYILFVYHKFFVRLHWPGFHRSDEVICYIIVFGPICINLIYNTTIVLGFFNIQLLITVIGHCNGYPATNSTVLYIPS